MRDPRVQPIPGDELRTWRYGSKRTVVYVTMSGHIIYDPEQGNKPQQLVTLRGWKQWARNATVIASGPATPRLQHKREIILDYDLRGQITRLANHISDEFRVATPDDETLLTLVEIGLEHVLTSSGGMALLRQAMRRRIPGRHEPRRSTRSLKK